MSTCLLPCQEDDPDMWFREDPQSVKQAKQACGTCPRREACYRLGLATQSYGTWGGTTKKERDAGQQPVTMKSAAA